MDSTIERVSAPRSLTSLAFCYHSNMTTLEQHRYCYAEPIVSTRNHWENLLSRGYVEIHGNYHHHESSGSSSRARQTPPSMACLESSIGFLRYILDHFDSIRRFRSVDRTFAVVGILVVVTSTKSSLLKRATQVAMGILRQAYSCKLRRSFFFIIILYS